MGNLGQTETGSVIHQSAVFDPLGLAGQAYWYGIFALHQQVFAGMLAGIATSATSNPTPMPPSPILSTRR